MLKMHHYLIIFVSYLITAASGALPDIKDFFPGINNDLSRVTWGHAINNEALLNEALSSSSPIMMLEADVSKGHLYMKTNDSKPLPVMAHPPSVTSDTSLKGWIEKVIKANEEGLKKGAKLDFKNLDIVLPSLEILKKQANLINFPLWLNADILHGPGGRMNNPIDGDIFLSLCTEFFPEATLSLGWTTGLMKDDTHGYTEEMMEEMINVTEKNNVNQPITFPIRASFVKTSLDVLQNLIKSRPRDTITIWTSPFDVVDLEGLAILQDSVGEGAVYFDIPESQMQRVREIRKLTLAQTETQSQSQSATEKVKSDSPRPRISQSLQRITTAVAAVVSSIFFY